jgi:hypothetical protein
MAGPEPRCKRAETGHHPRMEIELRRCNEVQVVGDDIGLSVAYALVARFQSGRWVSALAPYSGRRRCALHPRRSVRFSRVNEPP